MVRKRGKIRTSRDKQKYWTRLGMSWTYNCNMYVIVWRQRLMITSSKTVLTSVEMANVTKYKNSMGSTVTFSVHFGLVTNMSERWEKSPQTFWNRASRDDEHAESALHESDRGIARPHNDCTVPDVRDRWFVEDTVCVFSSGARPKSPATVRRVVALTRVPSTTYMRRTR